MQVIHRFDHLMIQKHKVVAMINNDIRPSNDSERKVVAMINNDITVVKTSPLTSKTVKITFDFKPHPAAIDTDIQPIDDVIKGPKSM